MTDECTSIYASGRKIRTGDLALKSAINLSASISIFLLAGIVGYVFYRGFRVITVSFLTTVPSTINGTFGIACNIVNTL